MRKGRRTLQETTRRRRLVGRVVLGVVLLVVVVGGGWYGYGWWQARKGVKILDEVFTGLSTRNPDTVRYLFSARTRAELGGEGLTPYVVDPARFRGVSYYFQGSARARHWEFSEVPLEDGRTASIMILTGDLDYQEGSHGVWDAELEWTDEGWRINTFGVVPPDSKKE